MELGTCSQNISGQESRVIGDTGKGSRSSSPCGSLGSSALCSHLDLGWALESGGQFPEAPVTLMCDSAGTIIRAQTKVGEALATVNVMSKGYIYCARLVKI